MIRPFALSIVCLALAPSVVSAQEAKPAAPAAPATAEAPTGPKIPTVHLSPVWPNFKPVRPVQMIQVPGKDNLWYVLEQPGRIKLADTNNRDLADAPVVVDLTDRVNAKNNEEGLLSAAFHPDFAKNRQIYVFYTAEPPRREVLSRFKVSEDGTTIDPKSEEVLLEVPDPAWNHNGGTVLFGPDGMLYLSLGDGGAANDQFKNGQNLGSLLAKILRIDVNKTEGDKKYAIPADNPFVGKEGARGEIWAYGLRNVWRMSFDKETGELWAGDVGQNIWEEIDLIQKGGNYGWNAREGFHDFATKTKDGFIDPVVDYSHREGISVTGGYVYRGPQRSLQGVYLYGDFGYGNYWGLRMVDGKPTKPVQVLVKRGSLPSSFAEARDGTLYVLTFEGGQNPGQTGAIWRIVADE